MHQQVIELFDMSPPLFLGSESGSAHEGEFGGQHADRYVVDSLGNVICVDPAPDRSFFPADAGGGPSPADTPPYPLDETFLLHSDPTASKVIYLDFDGHITSGTTWNFDYGNVYTPPYSFEGGGSFTDAEKERIQHIWERVAEDFRPFHVDVTTEDPGVDALRKSGILDDHWGVRMAIGGWSDDWYTDDRGVVGVSYEDSFNWSSDTPVFVFSNEYWGEEKGVAETISHEAGHTLGLLDDGTSDDDYYAGHGSGETGWAPIMGNSDVRNLIQWSKGEYPDANNLEDDLAIITSNNGFGYRDDDHGNTRSTATFLTISDGTEISAEGIIERNTDIDYFVFTAGEGPTNVLHIEPFYRGPNLDILARLYDATGSIVSTSNPTSELRAGFVEDLLPGTYYVSVDGVGKGSDGIDDYGYSGYASLGYYTISWIDVPTSSVEGFESSDFSKFPWTHSGDADWTVTTTDQRRGVYSARSGSITDSEDTTLSVTITTTDAGDISFWRRVSSESDYDYLDFYIDEELQDSWSGEQDWAQETYTVTAGRHTFTWTYDKDDSWSDGSDCAWIDDVVFPISADTMPPTIISHSPSGWVGPRQTAIEFSFDERMDETSFSKIDDVVGFTGPSGDLLAEITGFDWIDDDTLEIRFNPQITPGAYEIVLGPQILDRAGNPMDQDYAATFEIVDAIYFNSFDTNPGWAITAGGQWAFGQPGGMGGSYGNPDPTSGYTGNNVYGVNLNGDYSSTVGGPWYLTTPAIDCSGYENVTLEFQRWLNTDSSSWATATVEVSNDGSTWWPVYNNSSTETDDCWHLMPPYDISNRADGEAAVYIRWGYEIKESDAFAYSGWNMDDLLVRGSRIAIVLPAPVLDPEPTATPGTENTISWAAAGGADEYFAEYDNDSDFTSPEGNSGWISDTQYTFTGLTLGQPYYYRVRTRRVVAPATTGSWTQTSRADFEGNTLVDVSTTTSPGDVVLTDVVVFADDFEDGNYSGWTVGPGDYTAKVTDETAAGGSYSFTIIGASGDGVYRSLPSLTPERIDFSVRSADAGTRDGYFVVGNGPTNSETAVLFYMNGDGTMGIYDGSLWHGHHYDPGVWYDVSFDFDWTGKTVDYYVDGTLVDHDIPFRGPNVDNVTRVCLKGIVSDSQAWWDEIEFRHSEDHASSGTITSTAIAPAPWAQWNTLTFNTTTPADTTLTIDVLPGSGSTPIPGYENVSSGADLSGITDTTIRLRANLGRTDTSVTPTLHDWTVEWQATTAETVESDWSNVAWSVQVLPQVVGRNVFYNNSSFDGNGAGTGQQDDGAIASDKVPLRTNNKAGFDNYTNYHRGINGVIVDLAYLPDGITPEVGDFLFHLGNDDAPGDWDLAPTPTVTVREGAGAGGSDRVTIVWDDGEIVNQWLEVTVRAERLGLAEDDVFYFGNAVGETGNSAADARVTVADLLLARNNPRGFLDPAPIDCPYDFNRDGRVNATDVLLARNSQTGFADALTRIDPQGPAGTAEPVAAAETLAWLEEFFDAAEGRPQRKTLDRVVCELAELPAGG